MTGTPLETQQRRMAFATSCGMQSKPLPRIPGLGHATERAHGAMSSPDFLSAWSTCNALTKSRSSPWLMVGDGQATGGRESDTLSNPALQRTRCARR